MMHSTLLTRLTTLRAHYPDPAERQQTRRLLIINLGWLILVILITPVVLWWTIESGSPDTSTLFLPLSFIIALFVNRLIQHGQPRPARFLFVLNILAMCLLAIFPDYRIDSPFIIVLTLPLTAAGALLRRSSVTFIAIALISVVIVGGVVQNNIGMDAPDMGNRLERLRGTILITMGVLGLNTLMLWMFSSSLDDTVRRQQQLRRLLTSTAQMSQAVSAMPGTGEELNQIVEQLRDALDLYHVQIFMADPDKGLPALEASTGFIGRRLLEEDSLLVPDEDSPVNDALRQKDPILIVDTDPEERRTGFLPATQSQLLVPLQVGNLLPIGVLDLHSTTRSTFSQTVMNTLTAISNHLAVALYSIQQSQQLRELYKEHARMSAALDANQRDLSRMNRQLVSATWGTYLEEYQQTTPGYSWNSGSGTRPTQTFPDTLTRTLDQGRAYIEKRDSEHILCVPIRLRGQTLGAIEFRRASDSGWAPSALELAQAVADRLALSLENVRLFEQAQTTAQREQLVNQITGQLQTANDLETLLNLAANQFQDALQATSTRVRLGLQPLSDDPA